MERLENHRGTPLIEILQNCVIFNDKTFSSITAKDVKEDAQLILEHNKPMIFGKNMNKGIILTGLKLEVVKLGENGITINDILVHNAKEVDTTLHTMVARMRPPHFPVALGIIRAVNQLTFDQNVYSQIENEQENSKYKNVDDLLYSGDTWTV